MGCKMPEQAKKEAKEHDGREKQKQGENKGNMEKIKQEQKREGSREFSKNDGFSEALGKKDEEITELISTLQHLQADFENYRKRIERQSEEYRKFAKKDLIIKLLSVLDSFELALKHKPECSPGKCGSEYSSFAKGIELTYASLHSLLEHEGVEKINSEGMFNPELHEALAAEESDKKENAVLEEFQSGYRLHGHVLRHAKVKIAKKKEERPEKEERSEKI